MADTEAPTVQIEALQELLAMLVDEGPYETGQRRGVRRAIKVLEKILAEEQIEDFNSEMREYDIHAEAEHGSEVVYVYTGGTPVRLDNASKLADFASSVNSANDPDRDRD